VYVSSALLRCVFPLVVGIVPGQKFQALLREVHELKQQLQEQHLLPPPSLALGTVLGKAMGAR